MKSLRFAFVFASLLLSLAPGCSKKEEQAPAPAPVATTDPAAPAPAPTTPAQRPQAAPVAAAPADPRGALNAVDAAIKAREYEQAAQVMLAIQQQKLTEQQAEAARGQMVRLQRDLASALASGDPKAKAAAEMLRRSASGH